MRYQPVDLLGPSYADESRLWSAQDTVNWLPTVAEVGSARTQVKLATPPGLAYFTQAGEGPIRGARNVEGRLFVVSGPTLYEIAADGTPTSRGAIPGAARVSMSHNKRGYGHQLLIANGGSGYVFDTSTNVLTKITDAGYPGAIMADYLDHYLIQAEPFGRFWFHSELDSAMEYNTLDRYDAEASTDKIVGVAANKLEALVFSGSTLEVFTNTGAATGTFQAKRIVIERGCAARHSIVKLDNTVAWLGDDGIFYRLNGYAAVPISPRPIAQAIIGLDWANCFGMVWEDKGYKVAYWTFPDGQTWGYDPTQPQGYQWHRRQSYGLDRWRLNTCTKWGGVWIGGDYRSGGLFVLDWEAFHEVGQPLVSERTGPTANDNQNLLVCPSLELIFDTGLGTGEIAAEQLPAPLVASGDIADGEVGGSVSGSYSATGGLAPYTFAVVAGALPEGVTVFANGTYSGTFETGGSFAWTVRVTDALGATDEVADAATVIADPFFSDVIVLLHFPGTDGSTGPIIDVITANNTDPTPGNNWVNSNTVAPSDPNVIQAGVLPWGGNMLEIADSGFPTCTLAPTASHPLRIIGAPFTLEAWIYPASLEAGGTRLIMAQDNSASSSQGFQWFREGTKLKFLSFSTTSRASAWTLTSSGNLTNTLQLVEVCFDGTTTRMWIHGAFQGKTTNTYWGNPSVWLGVGDTYGGFPAGFSGNFGGAMIGEVRITLAARRTTDDNYTVINRPWPDSEMG